MKEVKKYTKYLQIPFAILLPSPEYFVNVSIFFMFREIYVECRYYQFNSMTVK